MMSKTSWTLGHCLVASAIAAVAAQGACGDDGSGALDAATPLDAAGSADALAVDASVVDAMPPDAADMVAPTFGGLVSATALGPTVARLTWMPATDDTTSSLAIVYRIYVAGSSGAQVFDTPTASSPPGATQMVIDLGATVAGTTVHIVVRAEDEAGNRDGNVVERSLAFDAAISFAAHIEPLLNQSCGGSACHGGNNPKAGLDLTTGKSYADLVGVDASQCNDATVRVLVNDPGASYLVRKLTGMNMCAGQQMPPGGSLTAGELQLVNDWIAAGAAEN